MDILGEVSEWGREQRGSRVFKSIRTCLPNETRRSRTTYSARYRIDKFSTMNKEGAVGLLIYSMMLSLDHDLSLAIKYPPTCLGEDICRFSRWCRFRLYYKCI